MKSVLKIVCILILLGLFPVSCDNCDDEYLGNYKFQIQSINTFEFDPYEYDSTTEINIDSTSYTIIASDYYLFNLSVNFTDEKIASVHRQNYSFINTCYALSIRQCYNIKKYVIDTKIDSIKITSDSVFNGILPGERLNNLFSVSTNFQTYSQSPPKSLESTVNFMNNSFDFNNSQYCANPTDSITIQRCNLENYHFNFILQLMWKPNDIKNHRFTISFYMNDGMVLQKSTKRIIWI